jgi:hypothetical protein
MPGVDAGFSVKVYRKGHGGGWALVGSVVDSYMFLDTDIPRQRPFSTSYKLVLNNEYEYVTTSFIASLPDKDRKYIRALRRREILLHKSSGRPGFLLKKRTELKCSQCDAPGDFTCKECYGSMYKGGFYRPVPYGMLTVNHQLRTTKTTSPVGTYSESKEVTRGLVYPFIEEGDVWVEKFTDRRFVITGKHELLMRGVPVIYTTIELSLLPPLSNIYTIPVTTTAN